MSFLAADRLIWLLAALPVILFYILKPRLRQRRISTLLFWEQIFEEKRQRSLWQNLRHWLSLLMQLLFIACVVMALIDPVWSSRSDQGQELVLIVDNSASMQATDEASGQSRLQLALQEADRIIQGLRPGDKAAVLTAGCDVTVTTGMTDFIPTLRDALERIASTDGPAEIATAIDAARRLSPDDKRRRIVVVSDACDLREDSDEGEEADTAASSPASAATPPDNDMIADDVMWVSVGGDADNVAITSFQARRSTVDPLGYSLLVAVQNFSTEDIECRFKLNLADTLVDVFPLQLAPGETWRKTVEATSEAGGILTGTLDHEDALPLDNTARAVVPHRPRIAVTLVKAADDDAYYLTSVLNAIPLLDVTVIDQADYTATSATRPQSSDGQPASPGLTVFSGIVPDKIPPGPVLFAGPTADGPAADNDDKTPLWTLGPELSAPLIADQDTDSPLLRHVKLQNVLLDGARDLQVSDRWGTPVTLLKTAEDANVMVAVERTEGRLVMLSANLDSSDLPLRIAFPVMMTNSVNWFLRQSNEIQPALATGKPLRILWTQKELDAASDQLTLVSPDGSTAPIQTDRQRIIIGPQKTVGISAAIANLTVPAADDSPEVTDDVAQKLAGANAGRSQLLAVNLCHAGESNLKIPTLPDQSDKTVPPSGLPIWLILAFVAGAFTLSEWIMYHRRVIS